MENNQHLFEIVDDIFIHHAGPIAQFICEEAKEKWEAEESTINFASIKKYIKLLHDELPSDQVKQDFIDSVKQHPSTQQIING